MQPPNDDGRAGLGFATRASAGPSLVALGLQHSAARYGNRLAVRDADGSLTFAELDALVATTAAALVDRRVGRDRQEPVALLLGRNRWSVVAVHAMFRAGVPFVPIDPGLPEAAQRALLARVGGTGLALAAVDAGLPGADGPVPVLRVPTEVGPGIEPRPVRPDDRAALVFTSGSTGRPKGVVYDWRFWDVRHDQSSRREAVLDDGGFAHAGVYTPFHWIGGLGRLTVVAAGASVSVAPEPFSDPVELFRWVDREGITYVNLVPPSMVTRWRDAWPSDLRAEALRSIWTGAEAAGWDFVARVREIAPHATVHFQYGSSESGGIALGYAVPADAPLRDGPLPLGSPSWVDRVRYEPVDAADGASVWEIVVRGAVACGYLDDPELTADAFDVDPDGVRVWRSGDLVHLDADGLAWYAGRRDDVVKINGRLVSPSEPERFLTQLDGVREAAVLAVTDGPTPMLIAHLVLEPGSDLTPAAVRRRCRERLPAHLVPAVFVRHATMPLLESGKADRVALRALPVRPWREAVGRVPSSTLEASVLDEVRRIVGFDDVAVDDDLTTVGLDSLGAVELCAAVSEITHVAFSPSQLATAHTVAEVCAAVAAGNPAEPAGCVVFNAQGTRPPVHLVPPGGGGAYAYRFLGAALGSDRPAVVIEPRGLYRRERVDRTLAGLAAHVVTAASDTAAAGAPIVLVGHSAGGPVAYEAAQRLHAAGRAVHCVLLDVAPGGRRGRRRPPGEAGDGVRPDPRGADGSGHYSLAYRARAVAATWTHRAKREWFVRFPGRPREDLDRYRAFAMIARRANQDARPRPAAFPVTLVHVAGGADLVDVVRAVAPAASVHQVGGAHVTMLEPPHVDEVAAVIAAVTDAPGGAAPPGGP